MSLSPRIRVIVSDSQPLFRYGLKRLLDATRYVRVVGEAGDAEQAVQAVRDLQADVLVINPGANGAGLDALKSVDGLLKPVRCVVVTNDASHYAEAAFGPFVVVGVLPRESSGTAFVQCMQRVLESRSGFAPEAARAGPNDGRSRDAKTPYRLTLRESQIVSAVAAGASNKDIASDLSIAEDTVKHHLSNIFNKVGVDSRLELAVFALYHGLVPLT
jgi:two-component system, NarL family, nitrate/nitrite response regulator NarL